VTRFALLAVLLLVAAWAFWRLTDGVIEALGGTSRRRVRGREKTSPVRLVRDPVCGTWVSPRDARSTHVGASTHYFCSEDCRQKFSKAG
jgi:YHS domain-containing protein